MIPTIEQLPGLNNKQLLAVYCKMQGWLRAKKVNMAFCKAVIAESARRGI